MIYTRRDSIIAMGDSISLVSSFVTAANPPGHTGAAGEYRRGAANDDGRSEKMLVGAARMVTKVHRKQLKAHIEQP